MNLLLLLLLVRFIYIAILQIFLFTQILVLIFAGLYFEIREFCKIACIHENTIMQCNIRLDI